MKLSAGVNLGSFTSSLQSKNCAISSTPELSGAKKNRFYLDSDVFLILSSRAFKGFHHQHRKLSQDNGSIISTSCCQRSSIQDAFTNSYCSQLFVNSHIHVLCVLLNPRQQRLNFGLHNSENRTAKNCRTDLSFRQQGLFGPLFVYVNGEREHATDDARTGESVHISKCIKHGGLILLRRFVWVSIVSFKSCPGYVWMLSLLFRQLLSQLTKMFSKARRLC